MNWEQESGTMKLVSTLHYIMVGLCAVGTIVIFLIPSLASKVIISILIVAYTIFILTKAEYIRQVFKISFNKNQKSYQTIKKWQVEEVDESKQKKSNQELDKTNFFDKKYGEKESINVTLNRSLTVSQDIKNISMSVCRSVNSSNLSDTRLSRMNKREKKQLSGFQLTSVFKGDQNKKQYSLLQKFQNIGIVLVDKQTYFSKNSAKFTQHLERDFEKTLKLIKQTRKVIHQKYKKLVEPVLKIANSVIKKHNDVKKQFEQLANQCFECKIVQNQIEQELKYANLKINQPFRCSYYMFLYKILLLKAKIIPIYEAGIGLKQNFNWSNIQLRVNKASKQLFKLTDTLGLDRSAAQGLLKQDILGFVKDYKQYVQFTQIYIKKETTQKGIVIFQRSLSDPTEIAKSKAYVLYLMIREINFTLKQGGKIKFNDAMNFIYPKETKIQFQINKRNGAEGPFLHYDLKVLDQGKEKISYFCQPGQQNYLSVLYFLLVQFSKKQEMLTWNGYLKGLVQSIYSKKQN